MEVFIMLCTSKSHYTFSNKTMTVKEFSQNYGIGENKAYEIVNIEGFPKFRCGRKILILTSLVDDWLISHIGHEF